MNDLTIIDHQGKKGIESRQVAQITGKDHSHLMRDIRSYIEILNQSNFGCVDFFIESTYQDAKGETRPCYLLTRKGCDMVANKMTGEKGVLFTAAYVTKFEEMEKQIVVPKSLPEALRLAADLAEKNEVLQLENAQKSQIINELQPKATYYDLVLQNKSLLPITKIAKDYGMSGKALNSMLHNLGIQYRMGGTWLLYQQYSDKGYTQSRTHVIDSETSKLNTYWTQKGRLFIYELLKTKKGILPLIERDQPA